MTLLGVTLMVICASILHWGHKRQMQEYAALGMWGGLILVIFGMATAGHG